MPRKPGPLTVDGAPMFREDGLQLYRRDGKATRAYMRELRGNANATARLRDAKTPRERATAQWDEVRRIAKHSGDEDMVWSQIEHDLSMLAHRLRDYA